MDKNLTLINSINASYEGISVSNGSINFQQKKNIEIKGKFNSQFTPATDKKPDQNLRNVLRKL